MFSLDNYRWAIATIWSRFVTIKLNGMCDTAMLIVSTVRQLGAVRVASSCVCSVTSCRRVSMVVPTFADTAVKAMVPLFDMLNHNPAAKTQHGFDKKSHCFVFTSQQVGRRCVPRDVTGVTFVVLPCA